MDAQAARDLLRDRMAQHVDDPDVALPGRGLDDGLAFPLHQLLATADPDVHVDKTTAFAASFILPSLGDDWVVDVYSGSDYWNLMLHRRSSRGYEISDMARNVSALTSLVDRAVARTRELQAGHEPRHG